MITSFCNIIKSMKKLLIFLILLMLCPSAFGEGIPPRGVVMTKETNPVYWNYLENYANKLSQTLDRKKMFRLRGMGASYNLVITSNGEIQTIQLSTSQNKYFDKKIKEIILSNKPLPFSSEMESDDIYLTVYLGFEKYNEKTIEAGWSLPQNRKNITLIIITDK